MGLRMNPDRIERRALLKAPLERVWRAIADSGEFGGWFGMKLDGPFAPGSRVRGVIAPTKVDPEVAKAQKPHEGLAFELVVERVEPKRLLSFRWHPFAIERDVDYSAEPTTLVEFRLRQTPEGVELTITESGFDKIPLERRVKAFEANSAGWTMVAGLIARHLSNAS